MSNSNPGLGSGLHLVSMKESYAKLISTAQMVVIQGAHHALPMEEPEKFNMAVGEFLARYR